MVIPLLVEHVSLSIVCSMQLITIIRVGYHMIAGGTNILLTTNTSTHSQQNVCIYLIIIRVGGHTFAGSTNISLPISMSTDSQQNI